MIQEYDQVDIAGRMTHAGQNGRGFGLVLRAVIHKVRHALPQHSLMGKALGGDILDFAVKPLLRQVRHKIHELSSLSRPASPQQFKGGEIILPPNGILRDSLPASTPDPLGKGGMDKCAAQASMWERNCCQKLFLRDIGGRIQYFGRRLGVVLK